MKVRSAMYAATAETHHSANCQLVLLGEAKPALVNTQGACGVLCQVDLPRLLHAACKKWGAEALEAAMGLP